MGVIETIIFSIIFVTTFLVGFDFANFNLKIGARQAYFTKGVWRIGFICAIALVYWYMNGMKFI